MRNANDTTVRPAAAVRALWETRVGEAMHVGVLTCPVEAPLSDVARIMASEHVHCVVVMSETDGGSLWGVVSDLDLVAGASVRDLGEQSAGGTAASPVVTIAPDDTLLRAAQLMIENATTHLVVVGSDNRLPVGVVSTLDVARTVAPGV
ncbi:MAG: CBS domain-containing protein [Candidatus Limnocylindria bacterium]